MTFLFSLAWIAVYTLICGDLATGLGCTCGLKDAVTAITFVALGTSVPDTFASKIAAEQDKNADPAIGNVTGSNAVNVFLGVGLSWLVGAVYHSTDASPDDRGQLRIAGGECCRSEPLCMWSLESGSIYCYHPDGASCSTRLSFRKLTF